MQASSRIRGLMRGGSALLLIREDQRDVIQCEGDTDVTKKQSRG